MLAAAPVTSPSVTATAAASSSTCIGASATGPGTAKHADVSGANSLTPVTSCPPAGPLDGRSAFYSSTAPSISDVPSRGPPPGPPASQPLVEKSGSCTVSTGAALSPVADRTGRSPSAPASPIAFVIRPDTVSSRRHSSRQLPDSPSRRPKPELVTLADATTPFPLTRPTPSPPAGDRSKLSRGSIVSVAPSSLSGEASPSIPALALSPQQLQQQRFTSSTSSKAKLPLPIGLTTKGSQRTVFPTVVPSGHRRRSGSRLFGWSRRSNSPVPDVVEAARDEAGAAGPQSCLTLPTTQQGVTDPSTSGLGSDVCSPSYQRSRTIPDTKPAPVEPPGDSSRISLRGLIPRAARGWRVPGPSNLAAYLGAGDSSSNHSRSRLHPAGDVSDDSGHNHKHNQRRGSKDMASTTGAGLTPADSRKSPPSSAPSVSVTEQPMLNQRQQVFKEGSLEKWTGQLGRWKSRRFVASPGLLTYWRDDDSEPVIVQLRGCEVRRNSNGVNFTICAATKEYQLRAVSKEARQQWLKAIGKAKQVTNTQALMEQRLAFVAGVTSENISRQDEDRSWADSDAERHPMDRLLERCEMFQKDAQTEKHEIHKLQGRLIMLAGLSRDPQMTQSMREVLNQLLGQIDKLGGRIDAHLATTKGLIEEEAEERRAIQKSMKRLLRENYKQQVQMQQWMFHHRMNSGPLPSPSATVAAAPAAPQGDLAAASPNAGLTMLPSSIQTSESLDVIKDPGGSALSGMSAPAVTSAVPLVPSRERVFSAGGGGGKEAIVSQDEFFDVQELSESQGGKLATGALSRTSDESEDEDDDSVAVTTEAPSVSVPVIAALAAATAIADTSLPTLAVDEELGLPRPPGFRGRTTLAMPRSNFKINLWSLLKDCVGKDLSRIALPVYFNEPTSFLQRIAEDYQYASLLEKAALCDNPMKRMLYVAVFTVSPFASVVGRTYKPFNPLLGETYEITHRGFKFVAEQVGHHPPTTAFSCKGAGFEAFGHLVINTKFTGKSLEIGPRGPCNVVLKLKDGTEEFYTFQRARMVVNNIIFGKISIDITGTYVITNLTTGDVGIVDYPRRGWWSSEVHPVRGAVISNSDQKIHYTFDGIWSQQIAAVELNPDLSKRVGVPSKRRRRSEDPRIKFEKNEFDGRIDWSVDTMVPADNSQPFVAWRTERRPPYASEYYEFGQMTMELNEIGDLYDRAKGCIVPPTDSRYRPDQRILEEGNVDLSNSEKVRLEEQQRAAMRRLPHGERDWIPRWFTCSTDNDLPEDTWSLDETYWDIKELSVDGAEKVYTERCPRIF